MPQITGVSVGTRRLDPSEWTATGTGIDLNVVVGNEETISITYVYDDPGWKFGDILHWRGEPASEDLMFLASDPGLGTIWVMALSDGLIDDKNANLFERMEEA